MLAERVDQGHVQRRKAADVAHVNSEIEAVGVRRFDQSAQGRGVRGSIDQLKELLVLEAIDDTEEPLGRPGRNKRLRAIGDCHTRGKGFARGCGRTAIPTEQAAEGEADPQQCTRARREPALMNLFRSKKLIESDAGASAREIDRPYVVQWNAGEELVNPQWEVCELLC